VTTDASITVVNIASTFGQRRLYDSCVRSDSNRTHRSTEDDPLPGGHFLFEGQVDSLVRYSDDTGRLAGRSISVDPIKELAVPDHAVVGENQFRLSSCVLVGRWSDNWLLFCWSTSDATRAEHERLIERTEGSTNHLRWISSSRVVMYWDGKGTAYKSSIRLGKETMEDLENTDTRFIGALMPKRHACAYRIQGGLVHLWMHL
jgi:hypothetical protein